jgi:hypothetical protein
MGSARPLLAQAWASSSEHPLERAQLSELILSLLRNLPRGVRRT